MSAGADSVVVRPMTGADLDQVLAIAMRLDHAPQWSRDVYEGMLEPANAGATDCFGGGSG